MEQPLAIENLLDFYTGQEGEMLIGKVKKIINDNRFEQFIFTGMGSSYFISHAASILFNELKMNSFAINTSELLHYNLSLLSQKTLLICISQSGESFEIKEIVINLPANVHCIGIVNDEQSILAKKAEVTLPCKAGVEEMTSTKTFTGTSLVSFVLGWYLSGKWNKEKIKQISTLADGFKKSLLNHQTSAAEMLSFIGYLPTIQIIARGPSFSAASQSALMFKEALHIPATGILGGEFRHGPMEMVSEGFKAILFAAKGRTYPQSIKMAEDIARFGGKVLLITNENNNPPKRNILHIFIDEPDEYLFSVHGVVPVQLFIDLYAKSNGFEAGSFSRGTKVTLDE